MIVRKEALNPFDFDGLRITDYTANLSLGSSLAAIEVPAGAGHRTAWSKRSDKYYLVVEGDVQFELDGRVADLRKGDFCLVRQGTRFSYRNVSAASATLVLAHTPPFDLSAEVFVE
jgi:mannose-6-phosphate isomerase-like protein (cupin superfamily)